MLPQNVFPTGDIVALVEFVWFFLHCAFWNVNSNRPSEKIQSHIICIYFIFLHCAFSNVSSNRLLERRHWLHLFDFMTLSFVFFWLFTFASIKPKSSNCLPEKMHSLSRPSCRCLWSLTKQGFAIIHWLYLFDLSPLPEKMFDCVISNASSNDFRARMQSCLIFFPLHYAFSEKEGQKWHSRIGYISPLCVFKCVLKWSALEDVWLCDFKCLLKWLSCEDSKSHW